MPRRLLDLGLAATQAGQTPSTLSLDECLQRLTEATG